MNKSTKKLNIILKTILLNILLITIFNNISFAQNQSKFDERNNIIKKYGISSTINIGWYTEERKDFRQMLSGYLPLSNSLSNTLNNNTIIIPDKTSDEIVKNALSGERVNAVYVNVLSANQLLEKNWYPVLSTNINDPIVLLGLSENKKEINKRLIVANKSHISSVVKYFLIKKNIYNSSLFKEQYLNTQELISLLTERNADLVALKESQAKKIMQNNTKFELVANSQISLNNVFFVSPEYKNFINLFSQSLTKLNLTNLEKEYIFGTNNLSFKEFSQSDLNLAKEINNTIGVK